MVAVGLIPCSLSVAQSPRIARKMTEARISAEVIFPSAVYSARRRSIPPSIRGALSSGERGKNTFMARR